MSYVVSISGSPAAQSRSTHLLSLAESALRSRGIAVRRIDARALPPAALMHADFAHPSIREALELIEHAQAVVISTPLYKASYSGLVKTLLDLLPQTGLAGKIVLPIATGGSLAHLLALDYALKPVLSSLGARHHLPNVFASDADLPRSANGYAASPETVQRVSASADALAHALDEQAQLRELRTKAASVAAASAPRETAATLAALIRCAS
ncbi:NADPH-dependent FMN reductase [Caballeronia telluris]|jgi:FMN reductase|uniref:NADPH-dependent FMN reductase n=1 Tax=Caballeronia telluris TaxID=326475 RepID=A0A158IHA9_9BURK|nr:NADPH-dependent FMN reductase [Caballeronia telluris]SAL55958.1 NADPH-dependent FMN reductase [Caballeronia telluris]